MRRKKDRSRALLVLGLSLALLELLSSEAGAELYGFQAISDNSGISSAVATQFSVGITEYMGDSSRVLFTFANDAIAPYGGGIKRIFFDDRNKLGRISALIEPSDFTVDFQRPSGSKKNFPEGDKLTPLFRTTDWLQSHGERNKVDPGEYLGVVYNLASGREFEDVIDALHLGGLPGGLRIGLYVGSIATASGRNYEDSFTAVPAPLPGAVLLGMLGISSAAFGLRRRKDFLT